MWLDFEAAFTAQSQAQTGIVGILHELVISPS